MPFLFAIEVEIEIEYRLVFGWKCLNGICEDVI